MPHEFQGPLAGGGCLGGSLGGCLTVVPYGGPGGARRHQILERATVLAEAASLAAADLVTSMYLGGQRS